MHARYTWIISALAALAMLVAVIIWWKLEERTDAPATVAAQAEQGVNTAGQRPRTAEEALAQGQTEATSPLLRAAAERPALRPVQPRGDVPAAPLAKELLAPGKTGAQDLQVVLGVLERYRSMFGGFPTAEDNASIVNALTGNNPQRVALLPRDHLAINAQGELIDRWQQPLFFHLQARDAVEIRSNGPDRQRYTADDLVQRSPGWEKAMAALPN